jgi:hypothetical protein
MQYRETSACIFIGPDTYLRTAIMAQARNRMTIPLLLEGFAVVIDQIQKQVMK